MPGTCQPEQHQHHVNHSNISITSTRAILALCKPEQHQQLIASTAPKRAADQKRKQTEERSRATSSLTLFKTAGGANGHCSRNPSTPSLEPQTHPQVSVLYLILIQGHQVILVSPISDMKNKSWSGCEAATYSSPDHSTQS